MRRRFAFLGLLLALAVALGACGDDGSDGAAQEPTDTTAEAAVEGPGEVNIEDFTFKPDTIAVEAGAEVIWTNSDSAAHSIKPDDELFETSPDIGDGDTFSHVYDEPGTYPYICGIHNSMTGTVVVT